MNGGNTLDGNADNIDAPAEVPRIVHELTERTGINDFTVQPTLDRITTLWLSRKNLCAILRYLKLQAASPYALLFDLCAVDERRRVHRQGLPDSEFTVIYHLLSFDRNEDIRLKVALIEADLSLPTISHIWPSANWYEREVWDMFGIVFEGHPHLKRILMPPTWQGHPLRKDHYARATETEPFSLSDAQQDIEQDALRFVPED
ncbi:MAG: NADH-quinone oxidoreductase subunit C, partial [Methylobacter sp.]